MNLSPEEYSKRRNFLIIVRVMYLVSFALIAGGLYLNQIRSVDYGELNTDYNNIDVDTTSRIDLQDVSDIKELTLDRVEDLINDSRLVPSQLQRVNQGITELNNLVANLKDLNSHEVKANNETLESILTTALKLQFPQATLNQEDLKNILTLSKRNRDGFDSLKRGQTLQFYFTENGDISYVSLTKDIKEEIRYIREDNPRKPYYRERFLRPSQTRLDSRSATVGAAGLTGALRTMGITDNNSNLINEIISMQLNGGSVQRNARVTILSNREYVGDSLYNESFRNVQAVKVTQGGKDYYAIYFNNAWYDADGKRPQQLTFNRYPFIGKTPTITSGFNPTRRHPVTGRVQPHNGIDFGIPIRTPIYAPADGRVTKVAFQAGGAGRYIVIQHDRTYSTVYMHLSGTPLSVGQTVKRGQLIAYSGNSGRTTGPHLHYEIHVNGVPRNPRTVSLPQGRNSNVTNNSRFKNLAANYLKRLSN
ncbi:peptidoglycan DD-metalloendopeptidase family protein [Psittacicella gerlachiana]|uniref:Uncharacterized protein n=1 Tax=Psittacicella gerlachiana TaxID=2028574 RepID=A0A3A1Y6K6_9GAMM|nr:peptidoglycan DD-metalloendopeptidase family protein [Psittacicella gerlachiana]RIY33151.1 hypothetical protein CKF59_06550 [Psittacicella gerlachiana]